MTLHFLRLIYLSIHEEKWNKAAVMENQVPDEVKTSRSHEMIAIGKRHEQEYIKQFLGQELEILVEEQLQIDGENYWVGHTREYVKAAVKSSENLENHIVKLCPTKMFSEGILY